MHRNQFDAVLLLAAGFSAVAAAVALTLSSFTTTPEAPIVLAVIVAGFMVSWVLTGWMASHQESTPTRPTDRVRVVPVPVRVAADTRRRAA